MDWSFQLYSARKFQPWDQVLKRLAEIGYRQVEGFGGVYADAAAPRADLDRYGLAMPSGHVSLALLESDLDGVRRIADALGITTIICPHIASDLRPRDAAGWCAFGERPARVGATVRAVGHDFAWHNDAVEFAAPPADSLPMEHIPAPSRNTGWQLDVAWVIRGGGDPW